MSISLRIGWGRISVRNSQFTTIQSKGFAVKLKAIVRDEGVRDPESGDNVFLDKFLSVHIFDVRQRFSFDPLGEIVCAD